MNREREKEGFNDKKEQIVEVKIEDMSREGQGIGRAGGLVVFVPGAVAGDVVRAALTKVKKNYAFSRLLEIVESSPWRGKASIEGICASFADGCGGCPYGGLVYEAQLWIKERQVRETLQRLAGIDDPVVRPIIGMSAEDNEGFGLYRYRNKAQFPVSAGGIITRKGGIVENLGDPAVGFYRAKSHEVVDCADCYLQSMAAMAAADALRAFMEEDHITAWDSKWGKGLIRHLIVKTAFATKEVMVILVINGKGIPNGQKLVAMLDEAIYEAGYSLESVVLNINKGNGAGRNGGKKEKRRNGRGQISLSAASSGTGRNSLPGVLGSEVRGDENIVLAGKPVICDMVGDLAFEISPASFYQVNPVQMRRLYDKVREYCGFEEEKKSLEGNKENLEEEQEGLEDVKREKIAGSGCDLGVDRNVNRDRKPVILDLYCGVGSIGLFCADKAEMVIGIERVKEAVVDANRNAVINGIVNARYLCGKAEEVLPVYAEYRLDGGDIDKNGGERGNTENPGQKIDGSQVAAGNGGQKIDAELAAFVQRADIAILDPPRAGCKPELLETVAATGVSRIVYVSCDPATLARDIKLLGGMGYEFVEATPVDMFPGTGHVETVVSIQRKDM